MTNEQKIVWAAAYAKYWTGQDGDTPTAVEMAWAATSDMRRNLSVVEDECGDDVYKMLKEMSG